MYVICNTTATPVYSHVLRSNSVTEGSQDGFECWCVIMVGEETISSCLRAYAGIELEGFTTSLAIAKCKAVKREVTHEFR
jgi:hypothetical protein